MDHEQGVLNLHMHDSGLGVMCSTGDAADRYGRHSCEVLVWAPYARRVEFCLSPPDERSMPMTARPHGYFQASVEDVLPDNHYQFRLFPQAESGRSPEPVLRADPASRLQPLGVHGPSQIVADDFAWDDESWNGPPLTDYIIYELHVGTATPEGTFEALISRLPHLRELGVTAIELMPVAEFPGARNWGYDGVYPFAAHHAYGGPTGLKRLVDASHRIGLAVILDVVYNHLGPEGNYLDFFGPYFTDVYTTPWGRAVNFDGPYSDHVRRFFLENARYWIRDCRVDALRVDAVHGIYDFSARPFLSELTQLVSDEAKQQQRHIFCIAESDLNDTRIIRARETGGMAFDAQWNDDFHHALHTLLTSERDGYYADFGRLSDMADAWQKGYVYDGRYSAARKRLHGSDASHEPAGKFVVFSQNHDQVGNRMMGERLSDLVDDARLKLAAACVLLSPYIPLLFMGEEYAEPAPFPYFISHGDPELVAAVRAGRRAEFRAFDWQTEPPDPQSEETFFSAGINPEIRGENERNAVIYRLYRELITLRKTIPALAHRHRRDMQVQTAPAAGLLQVHRRHETSEVLLLFHFNEQPSDHDMETAMPVVQWHKRFDTADPRWLGPGSHAPDTLIGGRLHLSPWQMILYEKI